MKKILLLLLMFQFATAQEECGVEGTFDFYPNATANRTVQRVMPISVWIAKPDSGVGGIDIKTIYDELDLVNQHYEGTIRFEICSVGYVSNTNYYNLKDTGFRWYNEQNTPNTMNIYFVNSLTINGSSYCGYAYYPSSANQRILMRNSCAVNGSTLTHEIGHYLGLMHTHEGSHLSTQEKVDGTNCRTAGDRFCSTPADPKLSTSNVNTDCEYTGNAVDRQGDAYAPSPVNIMSYSRKSCRSEFTKEQLDYACIVFDNYHADYSCPTLSTTNNIVENITIYPNPFADEIVMSKEVSYTLYDLQGRVLNQGKSSQILTSNINPGIYILKVIYDDRVLHIKVIK